MWSVYQTILLMIKNAELSPDEVDAIIEELTIVNRQRRELQAHTRRQGLARISSGVDVYKLIEVKPNSC